MIEDLKTIFTYLTKYGLRLTVKRLSQLAKHRTNFDLDGRFK